MLAASVREQAERVPVTSDAESEDVVSLPLLDDEAESSVSTGLASRRSGRVFLSIAILSVVVYLSRSGAAPAAQDKNAGVYLRASTQQTVGLNQAAPGVPGFSPMQGAPGMQLPMMGGQPNPMMAAMQPGMLPADGQVTPEMQGNLLTHFAHLAQLASTLMAKTQECAKSAQCKDEIKAKFGSMLPGARCHTCGQACGPHARHHCGTDAFCQGPELMCYETCCAMMNGTTPDKVARKNQYWCDYGGATPSKFCPPPFTPALPVATTPSPLLAVTVAPPVLPVAAAALAAVPPVAAPPVPVPPVAAAPVAPNMIPLSPNMIPLPGAVPLPVAATPAPLELAATTPAVATTAMTFTVPQPLAQMMESPAAKAMEHYADVVMSTSSVAPPTWGAPIQ